MKKLALTRSWIGRFVLPLVVALAFHLAEVGIIGLCVIVLATSFTGIT